MTSKHHCENSSRFILILALAMIPLAVTSIDLYSPALPAMTHILKTSTSNIKLTITAFLIGMAIGQIVFGAWSDRTGRRKPLIIGLSIYTISSLAMLGATHINTLIWLRALQGFGVATTSSVAKALLADTFTGKRLKTAINHLLTIWALGPIIAPWLGGYLQHYFNWQACFITLSLYGGTLLLFTLTKLPETHLKIKPLPLKTLFKQNGMILKDRTFLSASLAVSAMYAFSLIYNTLGPFLIENYFHYSPIVYGYTALSIGTAYFLGTYFNGYLIRYFSSQKIIQTNLGLMLTINFSSILMHQVITPTLSTFLIPTVATIFLGGTINPHHMTLILNRFPEYRGSASALFGTILCFSLSFISFAVSRISMHNTNSIDLILGAIILINLVAFYTTTKPHFNKNKKLFANTEC